VERVYRTLLKCLIIYCMVSTLTLPFLGDVWFGDVPVLALVQVPKVSLANWLRQDVVMELIKLFGFSRGSFSPDYMAARPYALAAAYLNPMLIVAAGACRPNASARNRKLALVLAGAALVDFVVTLALANTRRITIY